MNVTAARRSVASPTTGEMPPQNPVNGGAFSAQSVVRGQGKGRSLVHGLPVQITYAAIDVFFVLLSSGIISWVRFDVWHSLGMQHRFFEGSSGRTYVSFFLLYSGLVVLSCISQKLYSTPRDRGFITETIMVVKAVGVATVFLVVFIFASGNKEISRLVITGAGAVNILMLSGWRAAKRQFLLRRTAAGNGVSRVLIVSAGHEGCALAQWLGENRHLGYEVCGFLDAHKNGDPRVLGTLHDLRVVALSHFVDEVFITMPSDRELVKEMVLEARQLRLGLKIVPDLYDGLGWRAPLHTIGGFPVMDLHWQPIPTFGLAVKRAMDISIAFLGLIVTAPILGIAALWIRLDSLGPAIYAAPRVGKKGHRFRCYKLRTMIENADAHKQSLRGANDREGPFFKMEKDPRITSCGQWLRKFSIDELPQLINVLVGHMSLVGPRPHPVDDFERYAAEDLRRLDVKPGLTGLWQVTARRDPSFETSIALDLNYIENWSLRLDIQILLKTLPEVFHGSGS
jgi:exopolysaccharide biosynthesis polyprenyl glycosylphosphotransferase